MSGILTRLFERRAIDENSGRAFIDRLRNASAVTDTGITVTPDNALTYSAVWACVRTLAEDVGSLPLILYRRLPGGGKERATDHPLYRLLHNAPNAEMSSEDWREAMVANLCLWGNAYSQVRWTPRGAVHDMWPLPAKSMRIDRRGAELVYISSDPGARTPELPASDMLHVRGMTLNGVVGLSPITLARQAIGLGLATERFGAKLFSNGARPSAVLQVPGTLEDAAYERLRDSWTETHQGVDNAHRVAILEQGTTLQTFGIPPEEAQFLQTRKFQVTEIARWFRMPPHKIGDLERATFSNVEHQGLDYVVNTLRAWLTRFEQAIWRTLFTESERSVLFAEFLVDGLLRGDQKARYDAYQIARMNGLMNANEIRAMENMNAVPGGDAYWAPLNMTLLDANGMPLTTAKSAQQQQPADAARAMVPVYRDAVERLARRATRDIAELGRKHLSRSDHEAFGRALAALSDDLRGYAYSVMLPCASAHAALIGMRGERMGIGLANGFAGWWIRAVFDAVRAMVDGARASQLDAVSALEGQLGRIDAAQIEEWVQMAMADVATQEGISNE